MATDIKRARRAVRQHLDKYDAALGRFVSAFSCVEATLLRALWILARMEEPYAQAVLSGVRTEGAIGYINRIADAEEWSEGKRDDWQRLFSQIGLINKLRNDILHYGTSKFGDVWVVSNVTVAHHRSRRREIHITPKILDDASDDLGTILVLLYVLVGRKLGYVYFAPGTTRAVLLKRLRQGPWRYKQPPQADWVRMMDQIRQAQPVPLPTSRR